MDKVALVTGGAQGIGHAIALRLSALGYVGNVRVPTWNGCPKPMLDKLGVSYDLMKTRVPMQNGK